MTGELERLFLRVEDTLGIKAEEDALKKFREYLISAYGPSCERPGVLEKVFTSGEAAGFLTVNETYFFREPAHFYFLQEQLPSYGEQIRICSAATSTGCEAYSIAAVIEQYNRAHRPVSYHIDAFDINPRVIETAERGLYGIHSLREDGKDLRYLLNPYLEKQENGYVINCDLRTHVRFFVHNILRPLEEEPYDCIFFRNAFIYFSPRNREKLLSNMAFALKKGGILIMGVSETAGASHPRFDEKDRNGVFYFELSPAVKTGLNTAGAAEFYREPLFTGTVFSPENAAGTQAPSDAETGDRKGPSPGKTRDLHIDAAGVGDILDGEGEAAEPPARIREIVNEPGTGAQFGGNELAAAAIFLLNRGDFTGTGRILRVMEERGDLSCTAFLRGEYFYFQDMFTEAEFHYKISLGRDTGFWPALYRLSSLAPTEALRNYRAEQALESLNRSRELRYEVFIGGFSPDYYLGALLKQNAG
ncbi:MAG: hypothetical protein LBP60_04235 [Spirochaetaceae bacterium]|jgi:chemotaxis protein methyltransferase CheR|nr:hypothetical protein [Spirochaetaceae bacterium]